MSRLFVLLFAIPAFAASQPRGASLAFNPLEFNFSAPDLEITRFVISVNCSKIQIPQFVSLDLKKGKGGAYVASLTRATKLALGADPHCWIGATAFADNFGATPQQPQGFTVRADSNILDGDFSGEQLAKLDLTRALVNRLQDARIRTVRNRTRDTSPFSRATTLDPHFEYSAKPKAEDFCLRALPAFYRPVSKVANGNRKRIFLDENRTADGQMIGTVQVMGDSGVIGAGSPIYFRCDSKNRSLHMRLSLNPEGTKNDLSQMDATFSEDLEKMTIGETTWKKLDL